jgi:D-ribose pyranose/furanose isomerase RbsD
MERKVDVHLTLAKPKVLVLMMVAVNVWQIQMESVYYAKNVQKENFEVHHHKRHIVPIVYQVQFLMSMACQNAFNAKQDVIRTKQAQLNVLNVSQAFMEI